MLSYPIIDGVEFREIDRLPGYLFGSDGSIRSKKKDGPDPRFRDGWKVLKPSLNRGGYLFLAYCNGSKSGSETVHRLILEAFVGPRPEGMECRHLDGNKLNNRLENLCWGTGSENYADMVRHGTRPDRKGSKHGMTRLTEVDVVNIRKLREDGVSLRQLGERFGVSIPTICMISRRKTWTHVP